MAQKSFREQDAPSSDRERSKKEKKSFSLHRGYLVSWKFHIRGRSIHCPQYACTMNHLTHVCQLGSVLYAYPDREREKESGESRGSSLLFGLPPKAHSTWITTPLSTLPGPHFRPWDGGVVTGSIGQGSGTIRSTTVMHLRLYPNA